MKRQTHVMLPTAQARALQLASDYTRVPQCRLVRDALWEVVANAERGWRLPPRPQPVSVDVSLVLRVEDALLARLKALGHTTRIPQSEYLREAVAQAVADSGLTEQVAQPVAVGAAR